MGNYDSCCKCMAISSAISIVSHVGSYSAVCKYAKIGRRSEHRNRTIKEDYVE